MREMKDSGIEWIGEIPSEWKIVQVRYLFKIGRGRVIAQTELKESGCYPVYSSQTKKNGCLGYIDTYDFDISQLTWTTDGANAGTVFLREGKHNCTNVCGTLQPLLSDINLKFQKYALEHIAFYHKRADTNGYKIMNNEMAAIHTIYPPLEIQKQIADYLDAKCLKIDMLIEKQQMIIEKLKEYKLSIITEAVTKGLNHDVEMKDSGVKFIGCIPKEWMVSKLKYISLEIGDGIHSTPEYDSQGEIYFVNGNNIGLDTLVFKSNTNTINKVEYEKYKKPLINEDTILITLNGATYGKTSFYNGEKILLGKSAGYITLKKTENKEYIRYFLQSNVAKLIMDYSLCGSTIANVSLRTLNDFVITYPPKEEQFKIVSYLDKYTSKIERSINYRQSIIERFIEYKKSLIYEVVTGKREVQQ